MHKNAKKNVLYSLLLFVALIFVWLSRQEKLDRDALYAEEKLVTLQGGTMGTSYNIKYLDERQRNFQQEIDSLLQVFNLAVSTYIRESEISTFNTSEVVEPKLPFFYAILEQSKEIFKSTNGAFDPTVMPLVNAWGFGPAHESKPDTATIDSLRNFVGFDKIKYNKDSVWKTDPRVQLDFSAVAKGFGVDVVAEFLQAQGIKNLMVEIGGEVVCRGKNASGNFWVIGIDNPVRSETGKWMQAKVQLVNQAVATSGNYRNFYEVDGKMVGHTIDPATGFPIINEVLSASVFAKDCMTADGFATAFMVMGLEKTKEVLNDNPQLDAYLIIRNDDDEMDVFYTAAVEEILLND